jgi:hypothetical protein
VESAGGGVPPASAGVADGESAGCSTSNMCVSNSSRVTRHAPVHAEISPFGAVSGAGVPLPLGPAVEPPAEEPDELDELVEVLSADADVVPGVPGSPEVPAAPAVASAV